ncbi:MAG: adenosylmethionine--8-amino-7-oxononanoate transaminase [Candidatus Hydrogenedentota bacterium]
MIAVQTLRDADLKHLWHPYTDITVLESSLYVCFERGEGVYLYDTEGNAVLDGISSWWATALGHGHPRVVQAIREQAGLLQQSILGNQSHPKAVELAEKLAAFTPEGLDHCYFAADGASATEAAMKMAIQYWWNIGDTGRTKFVCLEDGYHGDTLGAVGVGFVPAFHAPFKDAIVPHYFAPAPYYDGPSEDGRDAEAARVAFKGMERIVAEHHRELAGVILEPLVQGAAGIRIYDPEYLVKVRTLCDSYNLLLIADEIAVGFGRTGALFACGAAGITPDILCLGKALSAGYLPISAAIATTKVFETFRNESGRLEVGGTKRDRTFYDGHTYCGNPICAAAAIAALEIYADEDIVGQCSGTSRLLREGFAELGRHPAIAYHKSIGMIGMVKFRPEFGAVFARKVKERAYDLGLLIRPLGDVLYLWPPLISSESELEAMLTKFSAALDVASED